jgi:hypothetical protein
MSNAGTSRISLVVCHFPAANRNTEQRRALVARNDLWTAWLRRPRRVVARRTLAFAAQAASAPRPLRTFSDAMHGLPWALHNRRVVPPHVEALCELAERHREKPSNLAAASKKIRRHADSPRARPSIRRTDAKHGGLL